jgi:hypothetical protein
MLPIAAGLLLWVADHLQNRWQGSTDVQFRFVVVDAESKRPIQNALVRLTDEIPLLSPQGRSARTGADGQARLVETCRTSGYSSPFRTKGSVLFPELWFHATAEGYRPSLRADLASRIGYSRDVSAPDPPPIRIELQRP